MRVFLTGATGLVGGAVARELHRRGHHVTVLVRYQEQVSELAALGYGPVLGDLRSPSEWQEFASSADAIVHTAMLRPGKRMGRRWVREAADRDRAALRALIDAARVGGRCKALCHTSGISVFGSHGDDWIDEGSVLRPGAIGSIKLAGEHLVMEAYKSGLPAFSLRPGLVYAASGAFRAHFLEQASRGKFSHVGDGLAYHSTVALNDLAVAYCLAVENPVPGQIFSVVDDHPMRWREFGNILLEGFGGGRSKGVPIWLVSLVAGMPLVEMLTQSYRVRNDKIKNVFGWTPRYPTFREGLKHVVAEFNGCADAKLI